MPKFNVQDLLYKKGFKNTYLNKLNISKEVDKTLRGLRKVIRQAIRDEFSAIRNAIQNKKMHPSIIGLDDSDLQKLSLIKPAFKTQGSFVYETLNNPAINPPQQIDLDDGVYLPMEIIETQPYLFKKIFFKIIDTTLQRLSNENVGWEFDDSKDTCARIKVSELIHIDVPLYAIPDDKYNKLKLEEARNATANAFTLDEKTVWLDSDEVYLAIRDDSENWKISDPMEILRWFENEKSYFQPHLVRVCRYLKGWRDNVWEDGGPSSIALMVCVSNSFRNAALNNESFNTDCEALLKVAQDLPEQLRSGVRINNSGEQFYPREQHSSAVQNQIVQAANSFYETLSYALNRASTAEEVVKSFIEIFGGRIPNDPSLIKYSASHIAKTVRKTPAEAQYKDTVTDSLRSGK